MAVNENPDEYTATSTLTPLGTDNVGPDLDNHLRSMKGNIGNAWRHEVSNAARGRFWADQSASPTVTLKYSDGTDEISMFDIDESANTITPYVDGVAMGAAGKDISKSVTTASAASALDLGTGDSPTFTALTLTGTGGLDSTFAGDFTIDPLAGQSLVLDGALDIDGAILGYTGVATITGSLIVDNMTIDTGSITDSSGAISFGDENLTTTGTLAAGATTVSGLLTIYDNSASVTAGAIGLKIEQDGTGDVAIFFLRTAISDYSMGVDATDDTFKISHTGGIGDGLFQMDSTGDVGIGGAPTNGTALAVTGTLAAGASTLTAASGVALTATTPSAGSAANIISTDASATIGPRLVLFRDSASPAASDAIGALLFNAEDSASSQITYASIDATIVDPLNTSPDGKIAVKVMQDSTLTTALTFYQDTKAEFSGHLFPLVTESLDIGSASKEWNNIYLQNAATVSDARRKNVAGDISWASDFLRALDPKVFTLKDTDAAKHSRPHTGFIAQEVKAAMDAVGLDDWAGYAYDEESDTHLLRLLELVGVLAAGWKDLDKRIA